MQEHLKAHPSLWVEHQLEPFNHFCRETIAATVKAHGSIEQVRERSEGVHEVVRIRLGGVVLEPPKIDPVEAVADDLTYAFRVLVGVTVQHLQRTKSGDTLQKTEELGNVLLCTLPAMVRSTVCRLGESDDQGG